VPPKSTEPEQHHHFSKTMAVEGLYKGSKALQLEFDEDGIEPLMLKVIPPLPSLNPWPSSPLRKSSSRSLKVWLMVLGLSSAFIFLYNYERLSHEETRNVDSLTTKSESGSTTLTATLPSTPPVQVRVVDFNLQTFNCIQTFALCVIDSNCRFIYHHVMKTGGTTIEDEMDKLFGMDFLDSCCHDEIVEQVQQNTAKYCNRKFMSYQVSGSQFESIVKTCMAHHQHQQRKSPYQSQPQRAVVLFSYREPIARTLSNIHFMCNHDYVPDWRPKKLLEACDRCDFEQDQDVWMKWVDMTNTDYQELYYHVVRSSYLTSTESNINLLAIDTADVSRFFLHLKDALPESYRANINETSVSNMEVKTRCSFGMTSSMIKGLHVSQEIYRNLTSGSY
jgi:hypothetical protein